MTATARTGPAGPQGPPGPAGPAGDVALAVVTVASNTSRNKARAEYKCDGVADQVEIQAAVDAAAGVTAPFAATPTKILLLDGTFNVGDRVLLPANAANITIAGADMDLTTIVGAPGGAARSAFFDLSQPAGQTLRNVALRDFTIDGTPMPEVAASDNTVGMIRDIGAGSIDGLLIERVGFKGGAVRSTTPITFYSDTGTNKNVRIRNCRVVHDGNRLYAFQVRKKTVGLWIEGNNINITGVSGVAPYNGIAVYAGSSDFHVNFNNVRDAFTGAHSAIACSTAFGGEIIGNVVYAQATGGGESAIEVQYKAGHGDDTITSHDIVVALNVVVGGNNGVIVNNEADATDTTKRPYNVIVANNALINCQLRGVYLQHGVNVRAFGNAYRQDAPAGGYKDFEQASTCTGATSPDSGIGGPALTLPRAGVVQFGDGGVYLPNDRAIYAGNAAGTSFQPLLKRKPSNIVTFHSGGGQALIYGDTSGRLGFGREAGANGGPSGAEGTSTYDGITGAIVFFNNDQAGAAGTKTTRITVKQGDAQVVGGSGQNNELLRFQANASTATLASVRSDGLVNGLAGLATKEANTTGLTSAQVDALFPFAPPNGTILSDPTNHLVLARQGAAWYKGAALTAV